MFTPQQIDEITFSKSRFGGYNMQSVDEFLEPLTRDYVTLYKENSLLKSKMQMLVEKLEEYRKNEADMREAMVKAQKASDRMVREAEEKCAKMLADAKVAADESAKKASVSTAADDAQVEAVRKETAERISGIQEQLNACMAALEQLRKDSVAKKEPMLTGKPSVDRPWLKCYPKQLLDSLVVPECTLTQYLQGAMPGMDVPAIQYYGTDITWAQVFENVERAAKSLKALGFGVGDQIPAFLRSVPEFIYLLLAAERIGASILCRDNTIEENVEAAAQSGANAIFAHDFLAQEDMEAYLQGSSVRKVILVSPCQSCKREDIPDYVQVSLDANYVGKTAHGPATMSWDAFLALGDTYFGKVDAPVDVYRPLFRCYTSGSTGPSKQVIHSSNSVIGILTQMNFYGGGGDFRPTWMVPVLPPALVAVVLSMIILPLSSNKLLILDPWVDVMDIDLEMMRVKPNIMPMIPMFMEILVNSKRIPADYDMSHLVTAGVGCEAYNNTQIANAQAFLHAHGCNFNMTTAYGSSESGATLTFMFPHHPLGNGSMGCPRPLCNVSIFKPGTDEELSYNEPGEVCVSGPGIFMGYDDEEATAKALKLHSDGEVWLHMGDIGYMTEDGCLYNVGRGTNKRFSGGFLDILPMENKLADANIEGIFDQFFVNVPDPEHEGYYLPYLYVVLKDGYKLDSVRDAIHAALEPHMIPVKITVLPERPFWHFKTDRLHMMRNEMAKAR